MCIVPTCVVFLEKVCRLFWLGVRNYLGGISATAKYKVWSVLLHIQYNHTIQRMQWLDFIRCAQSQHVLCFWKKFADYFGWRWEDSWAGSLRLRSIKSGQYFCIHSTTIQYSVCSG